MTERQLEILEETEELNKAKQQAEKVVQVLKKYIQVEYDSQQPDYVHFRLISRERDEEDFKLVYSYFKSLNVI